MTTVSPGRSSSCPVGSGGAGTLSQMAEVTLEDSQLLIEHARGDSVRQIAKRHGLSRSTAHRIIIRDGQKRIEDIEHTLLAAELTQGREPWPGIVIPPHPDRSDALDLFFWVRKRLRQRGWVLETVTRYVPITDDAGRETGRAVVFLLIVPGGET